MPRDAARPRGATDRDADLIPERGVPCAFCQGDDTALVNPFGGQLSVAQYWCRRCRTGFEFIKWEEHDDED